MPAAHASLFVLLLLPIGYLESLETRHEVFVNLGQDAVLNCKLMQQLEVLQVTWNKESAKTKQNVGTCNTRFGPVINSPFKGKVDFSNPGLHNSSIVVRNVTRKDECCYNCLFIIYPYKDISEKHCIKIHELYEPSLLTTQTNNTNGDSFISCSATGRPAPTVTWEIPEHLPLLNSSTIHIPHPNGTITVTSTVRVKVAPDTLVRCVASQSPGGASKEASMLITATDQAFVPSEHVDQVTERSRIVIISVFATLFLMVFVILFLVRWKKQSKSFNDSIIHENICTPQKATPRTQTITTPHGNNTLNQRMLPDKKLSPSSTGDCKRDLSNDFN
ncbi:OX-2 membrane glycoprotein-like [Hypomesus transpacificus]|uniref:OX-2 membrane glycoprotein-like n=1 Tax=Hypomesus transpacificus TaxID=137520 RepID=UPI001F08506F|nr:OX-2 membrane glycoprotein-like [Hypomesus transpacificus]